MKEEHLDPLQSNHFELIFRNMLLAHFLECLPMCGCGSGPGTSAMCALESCRVDLVEPVRDVGQSYAPARKDHKVNQRADPSQKVGRRIFT